MTFVVLTPLRRAFYELVGITKVEERAEETVQKHEEISGSVRDVRQRLESLTRVIDSLPADKAKDEPKD